ncbi:25111_t:CDS:2, partial [Racocetra persica]
IKDMLDARLITVWMRLLTSNSMWATYERNKIHYILGEKRNISPTQALNSGNTSTKAWPTEWKPYLKAWTRTKGRVPSTSNWPWNSNELRIGEIKRDELLVKKNFRTLKRIFSFTSHSTNFSAGATTHMALAERQGTVP